MYKAIISISIDFTLIKRFYPARLIYTPVTSLIGNKEPEGNSTFPDFLVPDISL